MNKKGQEALAAIPMFIVILLVFGIGSYIVYNAFSDINPKVQDRLGADGDEIMDGTGNLVNGLGNIFLVIFVGAILAVIISSVVINSHPVMFVSALLFLIVMIVVGIMIGGSFEKFSENPKFDDANAQYSSMSYYLNHIPLMVLGMVVIVMIILYVRFKG